MDIRNREKKIISLCDSTRDYTPDKENLRNYKTEENKIENNETNQRKSRKDMNCTKNRYKSNSYNRDCKPKKKPRNLKIRKAEIMLEPQKKISPESKYDDEKISQVVDEALKEIYSSDSKRSQENLNKMKNKIKYHVENNKNMPEIILETLINKLSSIMENEKENVIEKHCSKHLISFLKNNNKNLNMNNSYKLRKEVIAEDFRDKNFFMNFWNKYKKEIDDVINQLNQLYSILLNSVQEITYVFEYPFKLIELEKVGTKINIETYIKDKFFDIICNDELIKTLIQEIKKSQKNKNCDESRSEFESSERHNEYADICQTQYTHSTCDGNDEASDELKDLENENTECSQAIKDNEKENNINDLNKLVDYIMEDDNDKLKYSPNKKKKINKSNNNKKKKKQKKNPENNFNKTEKILDEEDSSIIEFKMKLENDSLNAKEKEKIKPLFSQRFLNYLSSRLN